jgi:hypothetical protein
VSSPLPLQVRRTTTLGALVVAAIMANVVMLNLSYDVPVKLGSLHILLLSLMLLAPDAGRLLDFFVRNRPTLAGDLRPPLARRGWARVALGAKIVFIAALVGTLSWDTARQYRQHLAQREKDRMPPEGRYRVESFWRDGAEPGEPALDSGAMRWTTVSLRQGVIGLREEERLVRRFKAEGDPFRGPISLYPVDDKMQRVEGAPSVGSLHWSFMGAGRARVTGTVDGHAIEADLRRENASDLPLMSRGFHWISEAPYFHMFAESP